MGKKAQSLSINVIIVAVLALIVLVILLFIFNSKINLFGKGVSSCQGLCKEKIELGTRSGEDICSAAGEGYAHNPAGSCPNDNPKQNIKYACCIKAVQ